MTDRLFLLNPGWTDDQGGPWYCPPGARIEGVLSLYPRLREQVQVTHLDHPRPRAAVVAEGMRAKGFNVVAAGSPAKFAVFLDYGIDSGRTEVSSPVTPFPSGA